MPLSPSGNRIKKDFKNRYGKEGDRVFYASLNSGRLPADRVERNTKRSTLRSATRKHSSSRSGRR